MLRNLCLIKTVKSVTKSLRNRNKFSSLASVQQTDDEALWVKSPLQHVPPILGYTVPEIIRENAGAWGNIPAFVSYPYELFRYMNECIILFPICFFTNM